jgi:hypothetical protein
MKVRLFCSTMIAMTGLLISANRARADEPAPAAPSGEAATPPPAAPTEAPPPTATAAGSVGGPAESKMRVGLTLVPMPFLGTLKFSAPGISGSSDAAVAFGAAPVFDYLINSNLFVGATVLGTFNVKPKDATGDAAKEYDLMLRIGGNIPLADKLQGYGYLSPGYSIISPPQGDSAKGFVVGAHVGAMFDVTSSVFLNGELGYQLGFQSVDGNDSQTRFFQIGLGGGVHI